MAADYWRSSQCHNWQFTHEQLALARLEDARFASPLELSAIGIWIGNTVSELCKRLVLRQRVTATATVFARRFYAKNSYSATDPCLVCASCVYVAAKVEEMPIHVKQVVTEAMRLFAETSAGKFAFPSDRAVLAEMEFYLIEDLEFDLIIHHPYRALVSIYDAIGNDSKKQQQQQQQHQHQQQQQQHHAGMGHLHGHGLDPSDSPASDAFSQHLAGVNAAEEMGSAGGYIGSGSTLGGAGASVGGMDGFGIRGSMLGPGEWAARNIAADAVAMALQQEIKPHDVGKVPYKLDIFDEHVFQMAWAMLNDVYRSEIALLYPPYLIALASVCLALVVQEEAFQKLQMGQISLDIAAATAMGATTATTPRDATVFSSLASSSSAPISVERVRKLEREGRGIVEEAELKRLAEAAGQTGWGPKGGAGAPSGSAGASRVSPSEEAIRRGATTSPAATRSGAPGPRPSGVGSMSRPFSPAAASPMGDHPTPAGAAAATGVSSSSSSATTRRPFHPGLPPRPPHLPPRPDSLLRSTSASGASSVHTLQNRAQPPVEGLGIGGGAGGYGGGGPGTVRTPGYAHSPGLMTPPAPLPAHASSHLRTSILAPASTSTSSTSSGRAPAQSPPPPPHNPLGLPTDPPPHPVVLFLSSLNVGIPTLAEIVQEMVSGYEVWHACKALVDDGRGMLALLEGMREKRRAVLLTAKRARMAGG
ncbi:unnamed protein product [Tilletia controversa]|nr:unnamed protein product [Tilletia controversa]CAD6947099.1 unnamed protein product [Tilletia controversa]